MQRVLVIDDNEDVRSALRAILEDAGYGVEECGDGIFAIPLAVRMRPDVILLDLQMPPEGGFEVLRQLKASAALRKVPVLIVTGSIEDEDLRTARKLGAWDYITKPWAIGEVEARLRLALQRVAGPAGPADHAAPESEESPGKTNSSTRKRPPDRASTRVSRG